MWVCSLKDIRIRRLEYDENNKIFFYLIAETKIDKIVSKSRIWKRLKYINEIVQYRTKALAKRSTWTCALSNLIWNIILTKNFLIPLILKNTVFVKSTLKTKQTWWKIIIYRILLNSKFKNKYVKKK